MASNNNISIKLDLLKLAGATKHTAGDGVQWLMIPIEYAELFNGEKGVYLDATAMPLTNPKQGSKDTHIIKQSFGKEKFAAMSEDEKKNIPILGNAIQWGERADTSQQAATSAPAKASKPTFL